MPSLLSLPWLRPGPGRPARGLWSSAAERVCSPCLCLMARPQAAPRWPLEVHVLHSQDGAFPAPAILPSGPHSLREGGGHRPSPHQAACPRRRVGSSEATWSPRWFSRRAGQGQAGHRQDRARDPEIPSFQKVSERLYLVEGVWRELSFAWVCAVTLLVPASREDAAWRVGPGPCVTGGAPARAPIRGGFRVFLRQKPTNFQSEKGGMQDNEKKLVLRKNV